MPLSEIYIKLVVGFPRDPKVRRLVSVCGADAGLARDLYVQMCLHCRENLTDGFVLAEEIGALAYPLPLDHANQLAKQLASVGLIKEETKDEAQGWHIAAYVRRNGTREDVERLSQVRAEAGRKGGRLPGQRHGKPNRNQVAKQNQSKANPETESETESETGKTRNAGDREDVERLCVHLADCIERNGSKRPTISQNWRDAARLMLDNDGRPEDKIHAAIDWCQDDEFWRINVQSMATLRKQYDRLRLAAQRGQKRQGSESTADDRVQQALESGRRVQAFIDQNGGSQ